MWKALVYKELRETSGIAAAGLLAYIWLATAAMHFPLFVFSITLTRRVPFLDVTVLTLFGLISGALAVGLAARQTLGEAWGGTLLFLLHRPVRREIPWLVKMLVGSGLFLVVAAVPLLLYAWWAATPGTHASPFEWAMTYPYWRLWISMPVVYLGAVLSGLRPARWLGTRLFPLAAAGAFVSALQFVHPWTLVGLPLTMLSIGLLVACSLHVARTRDYS